MRLDNASFLGFNADVNFNTTDIPTSGHHLARLRADRAPGDDLRVRQAFKLATDRDAIWERVQLGLFGAVGKDSPIGPAFGQYFLAEAEVPARDPAAAAALLAEAGYPDGLDMTLHVPNSGTWPDLAIAFAAQWEEAGIRVEIQLEDENSYWVEDWMEVNLGVTGWGARPIPQLYLDLGYHSEAPWNESHYSNARVDELIDLARVHRLTKPSAPPLTRKSSRYCWTVVRWSCPISSRNSWCWRAMYPAWRCSHSPGAPILAPRAWVKNDPRPLCREAILEGQPMADPSQ